MRIKVLHEPGMRCALLMHLSVADPLADALATYANATGESDKPIKELQDEAIPAMRSAFEQLRGFFHGCDYTAALDAEPANVLRVYLGAVDHVLDVGQTVGEETGWKRFRGTVKCLSTAFALRCRARRQRRSRRIWRFSSGSRR